VLKDDGLITYREPSRLATSRKPKEHVATGPCQVWLWDITYLKSPILGQFFYLYMIMDVWNRKIVASTVFLKRIQRLWRKAVPESLSRFRHQSGKPGSSLRQWRPDERDYDAGYPPAIGSSAFLQQTAGK